VNLTLDLGDLLALGALIVSVWAVVTTNKSNQRQLNFERTAERLNHLLIEKEANENQAQRRADLGVAIYKAGRSNYRMKVFNRGKAAARNVRLEEIAEEGFLLRDDLAEKFPAPVLEPHAVIELHVFFHLSSASRTQIRLTWDDDFGANQTKDFYPTV